MTEPHLIFGAKRKKFALAFNKAVKQYGNGVKDNGEGVYYPSGGRAKRISRLYNLYLFYCTK